MEEYLMRMITCGQDNIESFRCQRTHSRLKQLPLPNFYFTAAPNSGPIALLYRKYDYKQIKLPDQLDSSILLFDCRGQLVRTFPFDLKERVVLFQFTTDEHLLLVYATGTYYVLDTATATLHSGNYFGEGEESRIRERCVGAKLLQDRVVIMREKTLGVVDSLDGKFRQLTAVKLHPEFPLFQASSLPNQDIELVFVSAAQRLQLYTIHKHERSTATELLFDLAHIRPILPLLLNISYRRDKLVMVFTQFILWIGCKKQEEQHQGTLSKGAVSEGVLTHQGKESLKTIFGNRVVFFEGFSVEKQDPLSKTSSSYMYRNFYCLGWLDDVCYFSDRKRLFFSRTGSASLPQATLTESSFLLAEGPQVLRLIDDYTFVFRVVNDPIYLTISNHPAATHHALTRSSQTQRQIYQHFCQFIVLFQQSVEGKPIQVEQMLVLREKAAEVVQQLLRGAEVALDAGTQLKILKMAQWVQAVFGVQRDCRELTSRLRVVNGLKYEHLSRWLSLGEFERIRNDRFLTMMLRSNMHYVADLVFEDSLSKKKIFLHWAKCKIEKETSLTAIQQIQAKYRDMHRDLHSKFVFTELALHALRRPTPLHDLALKLAQNQPHPARKCIVFLLAFKRKRSLDLIDKLLDFAEQSFCTGAILQTLQTLRNMSDISPTIWLQLLPKHPFLESFYLRMLKNEGSQEQIQHCLQINKAYSDLAYLSLQTHINSQPLELLCKQLLEHYGKILPSLTSQLPRCKVKPSLNRLRELQRKGSPISEDQASCSTEDGELQLLGELLVSKDNNWPLALTTWKRIKSDRVFEVLKAKAKVRVAFEVAFQRKASNKLQQLLQELPQDDEDNQALGREMLKDLCHIRE